MAWTAVLYGVSVDMPTRHASKSDDVGAAAQDLTVKKGGLEGRTSVRVVHEGSSTATLGIGATAGAAE